MLGLFRRSKVDIVSKLVGVQFSIYVVYVAQLEQLARIRNCHSKVNLADAFLILLVYSAGTYYKGGKAKDREKIANQFANESIDQLCLSTKLERNETWRAFLFLSEMHDLGVGGLAAILNHSVDGNTDGFYDTIGRSFVDICFSDSASILTNEKLLREITKLTKNTINELMTRTISIS